MIREKEEYPPSRFLQQQTECLNFLLGNQISPFHYREKNSVGFLSHGLGLSPSSNFLEVV